MAFALLFPAPPWLFDDVTEPPLFGPPVDAGVDDDSELGMLAFELLILEVELLALLLFVLVALALVLLALLLVLLLFVLLLLLLLFREEEDEDEFGVGVKYLSSLAKICFPYVYLRSEGM